MAREITLLQQEALMLMQAMLGVISPNFRRVAVTVEQGVVVVEVILEHESPEDREELEECADELDALQLAPMEIRFDVEVNSKDLTWPDRAQTFVIYRRRENLH